MVKSGHKSILQPLIWTSKCIITNLIWIYVLLWYYFVIPASFNRLCEVNLAWIKPLNIFLLDQNAIQAPYWGDTVNRTTWVWGPMKLGQNDVIRACWRHKRAFPRWQLVEIFSERKLITCIFLCWIQFMEPIKRCKMTKY